MLDLYVSSVNKGAGKTFVSAGLAATMQSLGYQTTVYKPIQTGGIEFNGFMQSPALTFVKTIDPFIETHFTYLFKEKSEPLIAAEDENVQIDASIIERDFKKVRSFSDCLIADGECGIMSPIAPNFQTIDMIKMLQMPVLFVVSPDVDSTNNILMSIQVALEKGITINGVVVNNIQEGVKSSSLTSLIRIIEEYTPVKVLGLIPNLGVNTAPQELISGILNGVDIESVFNVKIEKLECC